MKNKIKRFLKDIKLFELELDRIDELKKEAERLKSEESIYGYVNEEACEAYRKAFKICMNFITESVIEPFGERQVDEEDVEDEFPDEEDVEEPEEEEENEKEIEEPKKKTFDDLPNEIKNEIKQELAKYSGREFGLKKGLYKRMYKVDIPIQQTHKKQSEDKPKQKTETSDNQKDIKDKGVEIVG